MLLLLSVESERGGKKKLAMTSGFDYVRRGGRRVFGVVSTRRWTMRKRGRMVVGGRRWREGADRRGVGRKGWGSGRGLKEE